MDSQLLTLFRKAAAAQGGAGFVLRFTGLSLLCAVLFGALLTPLAKNRATEDPAQKEVKLPPPNLAKRVDPSIH